MTTVLVAATSAVVRAGLAALLENQTDVEVVASATTSTALQRSMDVLRPDVVLLDIDVVQGSPLDLSPFWLGGGSPHVVMLMDAHNGDDLAGALRVGVGAVLPRDAGGDEIVAAVRAVAAGLVAVDERQVGMLLSLMPPARAPARTGEMAEVLTPRELEVLGMLAEGEGNKGIARRLGISEHTVKFHVGSIMGKLGAASRTEAVTAGLRHGLIMV